jgi:hypothetical protein
MTDIALKQNVKIAVVRALKDANPYPVRAS